MVDDNHSLKVDMLKIFDSQRADLKAARVENERLHRLLKKSVCNIATRYSSSGLVRWSKIGDVFGLGSTSAIELCRECGVNPHCTTTGKAAIAAAKEAQNDD